MICSLECMLPAAIRGDLPPKPRDAIEEDSTDESILEYIDDNDECDDYTDEHTVDDDDDDDDDDKTSPSSADSLEDTREHDKARAMYSQTTEGGAWPIFAHLFGFAAKEEPKKLPPPTYFEVYKIPQGPSECEDSFDDGWLPRPPSLIYE